MIMPSLLIFGMCSTAPAYPPTEVPPTFWVQEVEEGEYVGTYNLTAYTHTGNNCADGVYPCAGVTVACNDTRLWHKTIRIEGYGDFYVHDTGSYAVMGTNTIDIFVDSYNEAIQFGRKTGVKVYILEEGE